MAYGIVVDTAGRERSVYAPLEAVRLVGNAPIGASVRLCDGVGRTYAERSVEGEFAIDLAAGGALGRHRAVLADGDDGPLGEAAFRVDAKTAIRTGTGDYGKMWLQMESMIRRTRTMSVLDGEPMTYYVPWVRDNVHVMKAFKYWEPEVASLPEHFLNVQAPDGMIFDYFCPAKWATDKMSTFGAKYYHLNEVEDIRYDRVPAEADVEYLLVEGIHTAWQASGDDAWMARQLPGLERAIDYCMTDPLRWDDERQLVKRAYTIDTWDFKFFGFERKNLEPWSAVEEALFNIHPDTPMCIMHGDNSGMYQACRQVARMYAALGNEAKRDEYDGKADRFRENTNRHCWNGRYYDHWVPVTPLELDQGGVDGCKVLSLSNPYDVNRELPEHDKCVSIINEYRRLRRELKDTHFAEWLSVYPCWPKGFGGVKADDYVNGGIIIIVAGELAKAAFHHGFEEYAVDIVDRVNVLLQKHWESAKGGDDRARRFTFPCTYTPSGETSHGIPDNWAQAAVMSAMMEGLCGLRDESVCFRHARIEPRWVAARVTEATATARYGASDGYATYRFRHDPSARRIEITATGSGDRFDFHVLLPPGTKAEEVRRAGEALRFENSTVEDSPYADFSIEGTPAGTIEILYA